MGETVAVGRFRTLAVFPGVMHIETHASIAIGSTVGSYRIDALIGAGGMGRVYRAWDVRLHPGTSQSKSSTSGARGGGRSPRWLLQEAHLGAALSHPSICAIYGIGDIGGQPFIVMEHICGVPLATLIPESAGLPVATAVRYASQIADAVAHAHARVIVHRDLKSSNVMVAAGEHIEAVDFGLAIRRDAGVDVSEMQTTSSGDSPSGAGTVPYMAPELLRGCPADERSDIWALGVLVYEMLAGCRPFCGGTRYQVAASILGDEMSPLPKHAARLAGGGGSIDPVKRSSGQMRVGERVRRRAASGRRRPPPGGGRPERRGAGRLWGRPMEKRLVESSGRS